MTSSARMRDIRPFYVMELMKKALMQEYFG